MCVQGPLLSDERLFALIEPLNSALEAAKNAAETGNFRAARKHVCAYLRTRDIPTFYFNPHDRSSAPTTFSRKQAERAANNDVTVCYVDHAFSDTIDWYHNATRGRTDIAYTKEWMWQLNRMSFWHILSRAYRVSGDERYAQAFAGQLESWVRSCPRPDNNGNYEDSPWRTIEAGLRMGNTWPEAFHSFITSPSFADTGIILFLKSSIEHAEHLMKFRTDDRHSNWMTMEMSGLYTVGAVFPELSCSADWRRAALKKLEEEQTIQFLQDGVQFELSTGYHNTALLNILKPVTLARAVHRENEIPQTMIDAMEKAFDFDLFMMTPERMLPAFNDSSSSRTAHLMGKALDLFPSRKDYLWGATDGRKGTEPEKTSCFFEYGGYAAMRTGWGPDATAVYFDNGPVGAAHIHQDKLSLAVWAWGRQILFDAGGGMYDNSEYRKYDIDTFSHNTVIVDGMAQNRSKNPGTGKPVDGEWETCPEYDLVSGVYAQGYGPGAERIAKHTRTVIFCKPALIFVIDRVEPLDSKSHVCQARWHLKTIRTEYTDTAGTVESCDGGLPNIALTPLSPETEVEQYSAQKEPELMGWYVRKDQKHEPATTVTHTWESSGESPHVTLIQALRPGEKSPVERTVQNSSRDIQVIRTDGSSVHLSFAGPPVRTFTVKEQGRDRESRWEKW